MREKKNNIDFKQNKATFSKSIYLKRKYNLFSLISREFYESEMMFRYLHFIWKTRPQTRSTTIEMQSVVMADAYIDKWTV